MENRLKVVKNSVVEYQYQFRCYTEPTVLSSLHPSWYTHDDEQEVRDRVWHIENGAWIFDVGAAYGSYTLAALAQGAEKTFSWSLEGGIDELTEVELLKESLALNGWQDRARLFNTGLYSRDGWLDVMSQQFYSIAPSLEERVGKPIFKVSKLDTWLEDFIAEGFDFSVSRPYWLKLDVEGAEVEVLKGAENLIKTLRPKISVENHTFKDTSIPERVRQLVESHGYQHIETVPHGVVSHSFYLPLKL